MKLVSHRLLLLVCLALLAERCHPYSLADQPRPQRLKHFSEGFRAYEKKNWILVANNMPKALAEWPEDGEKIHVYGRWWEPYLPHYYAGVALYELRCYKQAMGHFERSILNKKSPKSAPGERSSFWRIRALCRDKVGREEEGPECSNITFILEPRHEKE